MICEFAEFGVNLAQFMSHPVDQRISSPPPATGYTLFWGTSTGLDAQFAPVMIILPFRKDISRGRPIAALTTHTRIPPMAAARAGS